jgi:monoterpene epsilon-lactone hydrolase
LLFDIGGEATEQRAIFEQVMSARPLPEDVTTTPTSLGGVPALEIAIAGASTEATLLWFHGGWYAMGSPRTAAGLSSDLARRTGARVISVDYRLAPEHPYPAGLTDARAAYRALLEDGTTPRSVALVGESAGGGLVTATLASLGVDGLPQPACAVLFSPWTDLTLSGASITGTGRLRLGPEAGARHGSVRTPPARPLGLPATPDKRNGRRPGAMRTAERRRHAAPVD